MKIPRDSEFVRSLLDARVGDDQEAVGRTAWLLVAANREEEAASLSRFFGECNLHRLLGEDDACRRNSVRSAIAAGAALTERTDPRPAPKDVEATLTQVLSLFWPGESPLFAQARNGDEQHLHYESPGLLRWLQSGETKIYVAARNLGPWYVSTWSIRLDFSRAGAKTVVLDCGPGYAFPLWESSLPVGAEAVIGCGGSQETTQQAMALLGEMAPNTAPRLRFGSFTLQNPYVLVSDKGPGAEPRFVLTPFKTSLQDPAGLQHELAAMDCQKIAHCPSRFASFGLRFSRLFEKRIALLPVLAGALLGIALGGLVRRSLKVAGVLAALGIGAVVIIGVCLFAGGNGSSQNGFALLGATVLLFGSAAALGLGFAAFLIALLLMRALRAQFEGVEGR